MSGSSAAIFGVVSMLIVTSSGKIKDCLALFMMRCMSSFASTEGVHHHISNQISVFLVVDRVSLYKSNSLSNSSIYFDCISFCVVASHQERRTVYSQKAQRCSQNGI